jgi:CubicO group peptidase (beta-lactamase class C family)
MSALSSLDQLLRAWEHERDLSGAVLMTRAGETVFEEYYGDADRSTHTPVTPATRFGLASITKMFTAATVIDLVSSGTLAFDTSVASVLPPERRPSTLLPEVTVHHLLTHTSGIADYCEEDEDSPIYLEDYGSLWEQLPSYSMQRPGDFLPLFGDLSPYRPPGGPWQYSNSGYVVLALVIEELTSRPFTEVVEERVFARAGMVDSGFFRLDDVVPDVAVGYLPRSSPDEPWRSNIFRTPVIGGGDGGSHSTARDLDRFLTVLADGTLLGEYRDLVLTKHVDAGYGYSQGYGVLFYPDGRYGHGGADPGVTVNAQRWPDDDVNIIVLCNMEDLAGEVRDQVVTAWRG